jgi:hypothetical protein
MRLAGHQVRSILLGYFIESLVPWEGKYEIFESRSCEPIYGHIDVIRRDREVARYPSLEWSMLATIAKNVHRLGLDKSGGSLK